MYGIELSMRLILDSFGWRNFLAEITNTYYAQFVIFSFFFFFFGCRNLDEDLQCFSYPVCLCSFQVYASVSQELEWLHYMVSIFSCIYLINGWVWVLEWGLQWVRLAAEMVPKSMHLSS